MGFWSAPITLDPGVGGNCLAPFGLRAGDIAVSTTTALTSLGIRFGTGSVASHALLYAGDGMVIEAIDKGVVERPLADAIADSVLVVAYRVPNLGPRAAAKAIEWARGKKGSEYSAAGAVLSSKKTLCKIVGPRSSGFFCSQLVLSAFAEADVELTKLPSHCVTPEDVVEIATERLTYVGHLKGNPTWFPVLSP